MESSWLLSVPGNVRSASVFPAESTSNPFEQSHLSHLSCVLGSDKGLHFRSFPTSKSTNTAVSPVGPSDENAPRDLYAFDLLGSLPGTVVACAPVHRQLFVVLCDDNKGSTATQGAHSAHLVSIQHGAFHILAELPRMSGLGVISEQSLLFAAGRTLYTMNPLHPQHPQQKQEFATLSGSVRPGTIQMCAHGRVAVLALGNAFYAVDDTPQDVKLLSLPQSSQIHPHVITIIDDETIELNWYSLFLANGRECAIVDLFSNNAALFCSQPRCGTVTMPSPVVSAAASWPFLAILTTDGLLSIRTTTCLSVAIRSIEVGNRPNDFFEISSVQPFMIAIGSGGHGKMLSCLPDTIQDMADRIMRLAIDAFGAQGFARQEVAQALHASYTSTSYVGPEPTDASKSLLKHYLESILGLVEYESGAASGWPFEGRRPSGAFSQISLHGKDSLSTVKDKPEFLVVGTALLCLVCSQLSLSSTACRAAKLCASQVANDLILSVPAEQVCDHVVDLLLKEASTGFSLLSNPSIPASKSAASAAEIVETTIWLLRSYGKHKMAVDVAFERLQGSVDNGTRGLWTPLKYESYMATHLSDLWSSQRDDYCNTVLDALATHQLLERNPKMGLSVFTATHPKNEDEWICLPRDLDPLAKKELPIKVVNLLKSIHPRAPRNNDSHTAEDDPNFSMDSGLAMAVAFLESAIGINSHRPLDTTPVSSTDTSHDERIANFHDELSYLLLEGVITERRDDAEDSDTPRGKIYRSKLQKLLLWPRARVRPDKFLEVLPTSFLQEKALILGRLGKHEDALRILYRDLDDFDRALEYCDKRYQNQLEEREQMRKQQESLVPTVADEDDADNAYLPLIRVALEDDQEKGTSCAIKVLALRRGAVNRAAALRLLPSDVPVSSVARPFLIPALVDSESQVRRLTVVSALLRARYLRLRGELTHAQLKAQEKLSRVPQLQSLDLGEPYQSSKSFRARTSNNMSLEVHLIKHFFASHLVIQAKVTNTTGGPTSSGRVLSDVTFVVAESSDDAISPLLQVPIRTLPPKMTGCCWCVLTATPSRMDGASASLTCELRYAMQTAEGSATPSSGGRVIVEELQDLEVQAVHFG